MEEQGKPPSSSSASNNTFTNSSQDLSSSLDQGQVKVEDEKPFSQVDLSGTFNASVRKIDQRMIRDCDQL